MQNQDVRHKNPRNSGQSGNALWFILIAIGLLAALSLTLSRNSGKMSNNLSQENARMIAERMIRDMNAVRLGVERLMTVNGCSESQLNFDTPVFAGTYVNATAPADKRCNLFDPLGAGLEVTPLPQGAIVPGNAWAERGFVYLGGNSVNGVGPENATQTVCASECADLLMLQQQIEPLVCDEFNRILNVNGGVTPDETDTIATGSYFTGTYGPGTATGNRISVGAGTSGTSLYGVRAACVRTGGTLHNVYMTLLAR